MTLRTRAQLTTARLGKAAAVDLPPEPAAAGRSHCSSAIRRSRTASSAALSTGCGRWSPRMRCEPGERARGVELAGGDALRRLAAARSAGPSARTRRAAARRSAARARIRDRTACISPLASTNVTGPRALTIVGCAPTSPPSKVQLRKAANNGLSGRGRRRDGQCRARDAEHPRRAAIPARRGRGGRLARARPAT